MGLWPDPTGLMFTFCLGSMESWLLSVVLPREQKQATARSLSLAGPAREDRSTHRESTGLRICALSGGAAVGIQPRVLNPSYFSTQEIREVGKQSHVFGPLCWTPPSCTDRSAKPLLMIEPEGSAKGRETSCAGLWVQSVRKRWWQGIPAVLALSSAQS